MEYELRANADAIAGEARITVDVLKAGWVRVDMPAGLLVRARPRDGRPVALIGTPAPHVLLPIQGAWCSSLDLVVAVRGQSVTPSR